MNPVLSSRNTLTHRSLLHRRYASKLKCNADLTRSLVSFQANKAAPFYRWFKYREAFSHDLVRYVLTRFRPHRTGLPTVLDPFAGAGTTLTTGTQLGWQATGIELLPVGIAAMNARLTADTVDVGHFLLAIERLKSLDPSLLPEPSYRFPHLRITRGAFPDYNERALGQFMAYLLTESNEQVRRLLHFAALAVLEDISYTRKDGQYLRWDARSGRCLKSDFNKGELALFWTVLLSKLDIIYEDLAQRNGRAFPRNVEIIQGSCLDALPGLASDRFDLIMTSPPYCNRYDYTRIYALELAFTGHSETEVASLRQTLLSATVENKTKRNALRESYAGRGDLSRFEAAERAFAAQAALQEVLGLLPEAQHRGDLNNSNIPTMVKNYFYEMNLVIWEMARVVAPGGHIVMVNDNVQYHGEEVPVDLILSDLAVAAGLRVSEIWVLPKGKGNSSQQMGEHGRNEMRKCVYIWSKPSNSET